MSVRIIKKPLRCHLRISNTRGVSAFNARGLGYRVAYKWSIYFSVIFTPRVYQ